MQKSKFYFLFFLFFLFTLHASRFTNSYAGEAILTWEAPITNADGTPLTDLEGYKIYYGTVSRDDPSFTQYDELLEDAGNVTEYTINNLSEGITYYFTATAYDTAGNESEYSEEVSKTIEASDSGEPQDNTKTEDTNNGTSSNVGDNMPQGPGENSSGASSTVSSAQTKPSGCGITSNTNNPISNTILFLIATLLILVRRKKG